MVEFVRLEYKNYPPGSAELSGHQEVIERRISQGYTYTGFVPVKFGPSGKMLIIDLVFEKQ